MANRQTVTRLRLWTAVFFNIVAEVDSYEIHPDMADKKKLQ